MHFCRGAASFNTLLSVMGQDRSIQDVAQQEHNNRNTLLSDKYERVVFWVEHDNYDQLMLLRCLTYLDNVSDKIIEVIELNHFPGTARFIGFGQLPAEAIRSCWQHRKPINAKLMSQAKDCWDAVSSDNPNSIVTLLQQHELDCLPNIKAVMTRHLQELPHLESGLSFTQHLALDVLAEQSHAISISKWFQLYQQREPLPYLGDIMFYALILPFVTAKLPLITIDSLHKSWWEQQVTITLRGKQCLKGKGKLIQEYWVGGISNTMQSRWMWDHTHLSTLTYIQHQ